MSQIKKGLQTPRPQTDPLQNRRGQVGASYGERQRLAQTQISAPNTLQKIRDFFSEKPNHIEQFASSHDRFEINQRPLDQHLVRKKTQVEEGLTHGDSTVTDALRLKFLDALLKTKV